MYNGAGYLAECIESVLNQTYENWEYVISDNCSTDGSLEIARSYEARDPRVRVVAADVFLEQLASANRSLREISPDSKYTKVLHADDWMFPECLERMVGVAERDPNVGIVGAYRLEETRVTLDGIPYSISILSGRESARSTLLGLPYPHVLGSPSSLLIRSDLIRERDPFYDPEYPFREEYSFTEDQDVCCEIFRTSDFGFVHQVLTFTRRPEGSPFSEFVSFGAHLPERINLLVKHGPVFLEKAEYQRDLAIVIAQYGFFLLRNVRRLLNPEIRAYHRTALERLLRSFDTRDVIAGVGIQLRRMRETRKLRPGRI
ncbi:MAG: glycosyltransferase [Actinomycetota bacterium]|nr:glycosyltransferase [Actinomycetota bacterium]